MASLAGLFDLRCDVGCVQVAGGTGGRGALPWAGGELTASGSGAWGCAQQARDVADRAWCCVASRLAVPLIGA